MNSAYDVSEMNKKKLFIGVILVLAGIWFYAALSSFKVDDTSFPSKCIMKEGTVRSADEIAEVLSEELGFDLEGAYKSGYTSSDVLEYLMHQPHSFPVTFYNGKFYEGRKTIPYLVPLSVCIILALAGIVMIVSGLKSKKSE
ncbi:MAG: hypothetical protein AB1499_06950 [Nitrospirota bacterium]